MNKFTIFLLPASISVVSGRSIRGQPTTDNLHSGRRLQDQFEIDGECTVNNFAASVGSQSDLASLLKVTNDADTIQKELTTRCNAALDPSL